MSLPEHVAVPGLSGERFRVVYQVTGDEAEAKAKAEGISLEQTVEREIYEEAGVRLSSVTYRGSQPWPFPASIMLGFRADALDDALVVDHKELEAARWFTRDDIRAMVAAGEMRIPGRYSLSYRLLEDWFDEEGGETLSHLAGFSG